MVIQESPVPTGAASTTGCITRLASSARRPGADDVAKHVTEHRPKTHAKRAAENIRQPLNLHLDQCIHILKTKATACHIQSDFLPASTSSKANHSHRPLLPLATAAAAAREDIRLWDRDWTKPGSADVGLEEGLGLDVGGEKNKHFSIRATL